MSAYFVPVIYAILQLVTYFFVGYMLRIRNVYSMDFFNQLSRFVVRVALPLYYFVGVAGTDLASIRSSIIFPISAVLLTVVSAALSALVLAPIRSLGAHERRVGMALAAFGNAGFMPLFFIEIIPLSLPLVAERFGIRVPLLYVGAFMLVQSPLYWAAGNYLVGGGLEPPRPKTLITPPLIGIGLGIVAAAVGLGPFLQEKSLPFYYVYSALGRIGSIIFPLVILCLGATIADLRGQVSSDRRPLRKLAAAVSAVRFLLLPLLFLALYFLVLRPLRVPPAMVWVFFLQFHIPPGSSLTIMAAQAGMNEESTSYVILATYILYLVVFPLYLMLFLSLPGVLG